MSVGYIKETLNNVNIYCLGTLFYNIRSKQMFKHLTGVFTIPLITRLLHFAFIPLTIVE